MTGRASVASEAGSGLVIESTSQTAPCSFHTHALRLRRMRYNVVAGSTWLNVDATRGGFRVSPVFVTLTYRKVSGSSPRDVSAYIQRVRSWLGRRDVRLRYVWVAELQKRGALHYHVILWLPYGYRIPKPDQSGWWPHGFSNIKRATSPVGYLAHYAAKLKSKGGESGYDIPRGYRIYGVGGLDPEDRLKRAWANAPGWLRQLVQPEHRCKRIAGGFVSRLTLEFWPTPYRIGRIVKAGRGAILSLLPAFPEGVELCPSWCQFRA